MKKKLIWLMGPSGSGKDSLLIELRKYNLSQVLIAHRYITKSLHSDHENYISLSEKEFFTRAEHKLFALNWYANNFHYGIGVEIDSWLDAGFNVIVNGSREHVEHAKVRYGTSFMPIYLQVELEILHQRLLERGREDSQAISMRLKRASSYPPKDCLILHNNGSLQNTANQLLALIECP